MGLPGVCKRGWVNGTGRGRPVRNRIHLTRTAAMTAALVPLALVTALPAGAVASTAPRTVTSLVTTEIGPVDAPRSGLTLSIVQICPRGSSLARARSAGQVHRLPPNVRRISRELWPRGAVTRWRVTGALPPGDIIGSMQQTVACREPLRSTAGRHDAGVSVKVRVWGPATDRLALESTTSVRALWGKAVVGADLEVVRLVAPPRFPADVSLMGRNQAWVSGFLLENLRAGQFAEQRLDIQVRSHLPRTAVQQITATLREIAATPDRPVYFLGRAFEGLPLSAVDQSAFHTMTSLVYGSCTLDPGPEASCEPPASVANSEVSVAMLTSVAGCRRLTSVRGVPTVDFGGGPRSVFTGHVLVTVFASGAERPAREREGRALAALRSVGVGAPSHWPLPPPDPRLRPLIDRACGARPGQSGPSF